MAHHGSGGNYYYVHVILKQKKKKPEMEGNPCSYILIRSTDIYILDILLMIKQIEKKNIYIYIYSGNIFHIYYLGEEKQTKDAHTKNWGKCNTFHST